MIREKPSYEKIFSGEIKENPKKGKILVIAGYHYEEKNWGNVVQKAIQENIKDNGKHFLYLDIQNQEVAGGVISPTSELEIDQFVKGNGGWNNFEAIIDIHDQHEDEDGQKDMVKIWLGDKMNIVNMCKELSGIPRGGDDDLEIKAEYHPRVNKDNWQNQALQEYLKDNNIDSYGLSNQKIPTLGFDPMVPHRDIEEYLKSSSLSSKLMSVINSHLKIITKFTNLVLHE